MQDTTTKHPTKPCAQCGCVQLPIGILVCVDCSRDNALRFRESHPWLFPSKGGAR